MPFRPAALPTIAMLASLVVLVNLSAWQWRRHVAAEAHSAEVQARLTGPAATNADLAADASALAWRPAAISGVFEGEPELVGGRFEFGQHGYDLVQPFRTPEGSTLLVNRGWIPADGWEQSLQTARAPTGEVLVEGLLLDIEGDPDLTPIPGANGRPSRWPQETGSFGGCGTAVLGAPYAAIAATRGSELLDVYLVVGPALTRGQPKAPEPLPVSGYVAAPKEIGHLAYSVQWALIALTMLAVWGYAGVLRGRRLAGTT